MHSDWLQFDSIECVCANKCQSNGSQHEDCCFFWAQKAIQIVHRLKCDIQGWPWNIYGLTIVMMIELNGEIDFSNFCCEKVGTLDQGEEIAYKKDSYKSDDGFQVAGIRIILWDWFPWQENHVHLTFTIEQGYCSSWLRRRRRRRETCNLLGTWRRR